jgi:hypothetical protein
MVEAKVHPQANLFTNLYDEWIDNNQKEWMKKAMEELLTVI